MAPRKRPAATFLLFFVTLATVPGGPAPGRAAAPAAADTVLDGRLVRMVQENRVASLLEEAGRRWRPRTTAFTDVNLVSVRDGALRPHQTVVVRGGRFAAVGPAGQVAVPADALIIDGAGRYLLPGLADMHVHSLVGNSQKLLNLACGVTTVRDMDGSPSLLRERRAIARGELIAPTMYVAGRILNAVPMEDYARVVTTPDEARAAVREQKRDGYDFVKVHNVLPPDIYAAVLDEAHRQSLDVVGHVPHGAPLADALRLGQRTIEHFKGYYDDTSLGPSTEDYVALTRGADVWNCPTFYVSRLGISRDELARLIAGADEMRYVPAADKRRWLAAAGEAPDTTSQVIHDRSVRIFHDLLAVHARFLTGTDCGGGYANHVPGFALQHELETMESLGMTPLEVLRASTLEAAAAMRREGEFGAIEPGQRADCVLAPRNPLDSVTNLAGAKGVMVRGAWLPPAAIAELLARLADICAADTLPAGPELLATAREAAREIARLHAARFPALVGREATVARFGNFLTERGLAREALTVLKIDVADFPDSAPARAALAAARLGAGDARAARRDAVAALDLDPGNDRARRLLEGAPLRRPPTFDPAAAYAFEIKVPARGGTLRTVPVTLEVTGAAGAYAGRLVTGALPDMPLTAISAVGDRFWATASRQGGDVSLSLVVSGRGIRGAWSAAFGGGAFTAVRVAARDR